MTSGYFALPLNMDRVCRICLTEGTNLSPIFSANQEVNDFSCLSQKIQVCGSIEIHEQDGLPSLICDVCAYKASVAHEFRQQCQHSDVKLRMYYNKPAKCNITDSGTQTDLQARYVLSKKSEHIQDEYFVKEDMHMIANPQEYIQSADTFPRGEASLSTNQIQMADEKLFICSIGFETSKEEEKDPCVPENEVHQMTMTQEEVQDPPNIICLQSKDDEAKEAADQYMEKNGTEQEEQFVSESLLNDNEEEEESVPQKRMSTRKTKSASAKTYSDDDIGDNYYEPSSDSQDSVESKFKCKVCFKQYATQKGLKKHSLVHEKKYKCNVCLKMFYKQENMENHQKIHMSKPHACQLCHACFSKPQSLVRHLKRHALVHGDKKYSCTVCKKWFFRPDTLKKHAEKHGHGLLDNLADDNKLYDSDDDDMPSNNAVEVVVPENETMKKEESDEEGSGEYKCQHCDKVMATKKGLRRHVSMHKPKAEPVVCEICRKVCASQARLVLREYLCHICSKVYPSNSSLTYHMRTHTGVKPHVCKTCNSGFTTTTSLANHIRIHTGDKPFICHVCSAAFAVNSAFRRHMTRHTGEAKYLCKTCGKAFKRLSTLKEHTYTHSGEKPYVCKTCGAAYSHSGSLFAHQKRCRAQYSEMIVDDHNHHMPHTVTHIHVNMNNVNNGTAVRPVAVIGQMF
ncbi:hypothetical protein X777_13848 [Ooceraea biroi]|uniref:Zinc finger protein n=1 Tax=Ooceraea biroi TaxID=2015173 RepID=A0A026VZM8_OOCBI|nr:hypothetical protein X777_13848 [Ooceraea biroi]